LSVLGNRRRARCAQAEPDARHLIRARRRHLTTWPPRLQCWALSAASGCRSLLRLSQHRSTRAYRRVIACTRKGRRGRNRSGLRRYDMRSRVCPAPDRPRSPLAPWNCALLPACPRTRPLNQTCANLQIFPRWLEGPRRGGREAGPSEASVPWDCAMTAGSDHSVRRSAITVRVHPLKPPVFLCGMDLSRVIRRTRRRGVAARDLDCPDRRLGDYGAFRARRQAATSVGTRLFPARASCPSGSGWVATGLSERLRSAAGSAGVSLQVAGVHFFVKAATRPKLPVPAGSSHDDQAGASLRVYMR
jgi:hypothetical protein